MGSPYELNQENFAEVRANASNALEVAKSVADAQVGMNKTMQNLVTASKLNESRIKSMERLVWPIVLSVITATVGAIFAVITRT